MSHGEVKGIDETSTVVGGGAGQRARRVADVSRHWALRWGACMICCARCAAVHRG